MSWHSRADWFWQMEFVAWALRSHLLHPFYMCVPTSSWDIKHLCNCSASQNFHLMYRMKASFCCPVTITANLRSLMQLYTCTHKSFVLRTEKCGASVCIWHMHICFSRMGMICRDQCAWNSSFCIQMTRWILIMFLRLFFFFMANLLCSKKWSHIPSKFCHLMVSRTSRTKMICLGSQKQLGAVGVTCQWQHCPALAAYKLIVIRLYPGNYTTKSLWGAMQLNGK